MPVLLPEKPAVIRATLAFYDLLERQAEIETIFGHEVKVFRGPLVTAYHSLGESNSYYTAVRRNLLNTGAIEILEKGAANRLSVVAVIRRPDESELSTKRDLTKRVEPAKLAARIENIERAIGGVDLRKLIEFVDELSSRLLKLEGELESGKKK
jgi:hypothetical protein